MSEGGKITHGFGAEGMRGGEAVAERLDELAGGVRSDVASERGLEARLRYLTGSGPGYQAMERAGVSVTPRTLIAWLAGDREPNKANQARIDAAYRDLRRTNVARSMKARLSKNGRGTRIEVHPVNQARVDTRQRRPLEVRKVNVRPSTWGRFVDQWAARDLSGMNETWDAFAEDEIGSDWGAYTSVSSIGFGA